MSATPETTVGEIVTEDFRAAAVFHRFGIDYCCGGKRTVAEACRDRGIAADDLLAEVSRACARPDRDRPQYAEWEPESLIAHIVGTQHAYVRRSLSPIGAYLAKLVAVHGSRHRELSEIAQVFAGVTAEMRAHMMKEEAVLFPFILELASARSVSAVRLDRDSDPDDGGGTRIGGRRDGAHPRTERRLHAAGGRLHDLPRGAEGTGGIRTGSPHPRASREQRALPEGARSCGC